MVKPVNQPSETMGRSQQMIVQSSDTGSPAAKFGMTSPVTWLEHPRVLELHDVDHKAWRKKRIYKWWDVQPSAQRFTTGGTYKMPR